MRESRGGGSRLLRWATLRNPSFGIVDIRLLYNYSLADYRLELFADFFNLFDNQDATP